MNINVLEEQEAALVQSLFADIASLKETHADYFAYLEDVDPDTAPRAELLDMMRSAPNKSIQFYLFGKYTFRLNMAAITGRDFS